MFSFKFMRRDLQGALIASASATGLAHSIDPNGRVAVQAKDAAALDALVDDVVARTLPDATFFCTASNDDWNEERKVVAERGVPFLECEFVDDDEDGGLQYCLIVQRESSLPRGRRPWDRE